MFPLGSSGGVKVTFTRFTSSGITDTITFFGGSLGSGDRVGMIKEKIIDIYLYLQVGLNCQR